MRVGYRNRRSNAHICKECAEKYDFKSNRKAVSEVNTSQYAHGDGGGPCVLCGIDVQDILVSGYFKGETEKSLVESSENISLNDLATILKHIDGVTALITPFDRENGVKEETTANGAVKLSRHAENADEYLRIDVSPFGDKKDSLTTVRELARDIQSIGGHVQFDIEHNPDKISRETVNETLGDVDGERLIRQIDNDHGMYNLKVVL